MFRLGPCDYLSSLNSQIKQGVNRGPEYSTRSVFPFFFFGNIKNSLLNAETSSRLPTGGKQIRVRMLTPMLQWKHNEAQFDTLTPKNCSGRWKRAPFIYGFQKNGVWLLWYLIGQSRSAIQGRTHQREIDIMMLNC